MNTICYIEVFLKVFTLGYYDLVLVGTNNYAASKLVIFVPQTKYSHTSLCTYFLYYSVNNIQQVQKTHNHHKSINYHNNCYQ